MDKETGEKLLINDKEVIAETKFTPEKEDGTVNVVFTVDTTQLEGKDIVVFEKLYYKNVEMSKHEDIEDKDQTIKVPKIEIKTSAINKDTETQFAQVGDKLTFIDTVSYTGLVPGYEYTMKGVLVDKETGESITIDLKNNEEKKTDSEITDDNTNKKDEIVDKKDDVEIKQDKVELTAETKFTPEKEDGTVDVVFTVDTTQLEGKDIVVFEKLYYKNVEMSKHEDIEDKDQTIKVPKIEIKTSAINKDTETQFAQVGDKLTFIDTVSYTGLVPGYEYIMKGVLMDKETGESILVENKTQDNNNEKLTVDDKKDENVDEIVDKKEDTEIKQDKVELTAETKFTPEKEDGTVDVIFTVDTTQLEGKDIVVFEKLYYKNVEMSKHEDIEDKDQTIKIPKIEIKTSVIDKDAKTNLNDPNKKSTFIDTVSYSGLVPNYEYTVKGVLMNKETGKKLLINNKEVVAETKFTPKKETGTVDVVFTVDTSNLSGKEVVVFEKLYYKNIEMSKHEDINDKNQTIKVNVPKITTQTGDNNLKVIIPLGIIGILGIAYIVYYLRKKRY